MLHKDSSRFRKIYTKSYLKLKRKIRQTDSGSFPNYLKSSDIDKSQIMMKDTLYVGQIVGLLLMRISVHLTRLDSMGVLQVPSLKCCFLIGSWKYAFLVAVQTCGIASYQTWLFHSTGARIGVELGDSLICLWRRAVLFFVLIGCCELSSIFI